MVLRVALDTSFAGINLTGVGKYSRRLSEGLSLISGARSLDVRCLGPSCTPDPGRLALGGLYQEWPSYTQLFLPLALSLSRRPPHIVHSTSHLGPLWGPGRKVVTVHDLIFLRFPADYARSWLGITKALLPRVLRRASAILADSQATRDDIARFYPWARAKVRVVYPGIEEAFGRSISEEAIRHAKEKYRLGADPYLLCLGPWVRRKNLRVVIRAFERVAERLPSVNLVLTGEAPAGMHSGDLTDTLRRVPANTRDRVRAVGHVAREELPALVKGAALLAYPSLYEGFGLPPLEAMSAGVPVVASATPAVAEAAGDAALLIAPDDIRGWAAAIERVLTDGGLALELRSKGLERSARFSWMRCAEETADIYYAIARPDFPVLRCG